MRQEEAVCTVENSYGYILGLLSCSAQVLSDHRLHHLTLQVDRNGRHIRCLNHPLLSEHHFLRWKFVYQLISEDNDAISVLYDSFKLMHRL